MPSAAASDAPQGAAAMNRLRFVVLIVALVLPLAFLFVSGPIEANPTAM
jgi:hypothetical protein